MPSYEDFYVRQAFRKYQHAERSSRSLVIRTKYKNEEELSLLRWPTARDRSGLVRKGRSVCTVAPRIGSSPFFSALFNQATMTYVQNLVALAQEKGSPSSRPLHLFVFCADHKPGSKSLLRKVSEYVQQVSPYPSFLTVIPMWFQPEVIAPLANGRHHLHPLCRGQTAMRSSCAQGASGSIRRRRRRVQHHARGSIARDSRVGIGRRRLLAADVWRQDRDAPLVSPSREKCVFLRDSIIAFALEFSPMQRLFWVLLTLVAFFLPIERRYDRLFRFYSRRSRRALSPLWL